jgi:hypothetical protein
MNATLAALLAAQAAYRAARRKVRELPDGHPELPDALLNLEAASEQLAKIQREHDSKGSEQG